MIFFTPKGITIYTPPQQKMPPPVFVTEVVGDKVYAISAEETHAAGLKIPSTAKHVSFAYYGRSYKTKRLHYNYMLSGYDTDWQATWEEAVSYDNLKPGAYTFSVIAINRDLVSSDKPAIVHLKVVPPWYQNGWIVIPSGAGILALLIYSIMSTIRYVGAQVQIRKLNAQLQDENVRMGADKSLTLCLLDYADGEVKLSGQHEELIVVRGDGKVGLIDTVDLGFPIGLDDDIADFIGQTTIQLVPGDGVVLYTDGITEAENEGREQYGLQRLCEVVSQHWVQSAEGIKDAVVADVEGFIGEAEIFDDITLVVLKQK